MYIWGAGFLGNRAIDKYGKDGVSGIIDNSSEKQGSYINGVKVISFEEYKTSTEKDKNILICASWENALEIQEQLEKENVLEYSLFLEQLFENVDLIYNQYENFNGQSEDEWNAQIYIDHNYDKVSDYVNRYCNNVQLFHEIEIETVNKCNGGCSFCPVSVNKDIREYRKMSDELFEKIVSELEEINYMGRVALFSNNEPLLDDSILIRSKILRKRVPKAKIHMFTNGTLLTIEVFDELIKYLDELIIDNYNQQLRLIPTIKAIKEHIDINCSDDVRKKVKILLRKTEEYLSSRGGDAPNRKNVIDVGNMKCALPFCQMVIRPSGEVSLCCNDPYGKDTLGDVNVNTLVDIWNGEKYKKIRKVLAEGRGNYKHCQNCDTFMLI